MSKIINHKDWPSAISKETICVIPTENRFKVGELVFCTHLGIPQPNEIPVDLENFFASQRELYNRQERTRSVAIVDMDYNSYTNALKLARTILGVEKRIPAITVVRTHISNAPLFEQNIRFLRNQGIHGIAIEENQQFDDLILVGEIIKELSAKG